MVFAVEYLLGHDTQLGHTRQKRLTGAIEPHSQMPIVGNIDGARTTMDGLVTSSQSATGALQAAQAGNQLLALQSQQLADLTALLAAQGRAQALDSARNAAVEAESRERLRRFLTRSTGYQPGNARMFHD